jgi:hypothetical protein
VVVGTSLAAGGVAALNQWLEHDTDAQMKRTADRPIPTGKVATGSAFVLGALMCAAALGLIFAKVNGLGRVLHPADHHLLPRLVHAREALVALWSTEIGALAGAFPPLIGWAPARGGSRRSAGSFSACCSSGRCRTSWPSRGPTGATTAAVHFPMLPVRDESGAKVAAWSFVNALALFVVSLLPVYSGWPPYGIAAAILGGLWFLAGDRCSCVRSDATWPRANCFSPPSSTSPRARGAGGRPRDLFLTRHDHPGHPRPQRLAQRPRHAADDRRFHLVKTGRKEAHRTAMISACVVSACSSSATWRTRFSCAACTPPSAAPVPSRTVYYVMLVTHILLAISIAYLVPRTFLFAIKGDFERHKRWAKWTFPIWYYVSVTGVLVYFFPLPVVAGRSLISGRSPLRSREHFAAA